MGGFPSGQRGQTVNLLQLASVVRIHLRPYAAVAELADAQDLKSCGTYTPVPVRFRFAALTKRKRNVEYSAFLFLFCFVKVEKGGQNYNTRTVSPAFAFPASRTFTKIPSRGITQSPAASLIAQPRWHSFPICVTSQIALPILSFVPTGSL